MTPNEQNQEAMRRFREAIAAGFTVEMYDLSVIQDDNERVLILSSVTNPVTPDSERRHLAKRCYG